MKYTRKISEGLGNRIVKICDEMSRVQKLTNEELVLEALANFPASDCVMQGDILLEEMMTRLHPRWMYSNCKRCGQEIEPDSNPDGCRDPECPQL